MPDTLMGGELPVHPVADLFPMLPEDERADLAAEIKENGLKFPIMLDAPGKLLIDGRNRLAACGIAGVVPRFERLTKDEDFRFHLVDQHRAQASDQRPDREGVPAFDLNWPNCARETLATRAPSAD